jgi:hypothetical protein
MNFAIMLFVLPAYPASMTHSGIPLGVRLCLGMPEWTAISLIGIAHPDDLIADLIPAFHAAWESPLRCRRSRLSIRDIREAFGVSGTDRLCRLIVPSPSSCPCRPAYEYCFAV